MEMYHQLQQAAEHTKRAELHLQQLSGVPVSLVPTSNCCVCTAIKREEEGKQEEHCTFDALLLNKLNDMKRENVKHKVPTVRAIARLMCSNESSGVCSFIL
jgi:hypothetical protein